MTQYSIFYHTVTIDTIIKSHKDKHNSELSLQWSMYSNILVFFCSATTAPLSGGPYFTLGLEMDYILRDNSCSVLSSRDNSKHPSLCPTPLLPFAFTLPLLPFAVTPPYTPICLHPSLYSHWLAPQPSTRIPDKFIQ